jgi:hypothetical protein
VPICLSALRRAQIPVASSIESLLQPAGVEGDPALVLPAAGVRVLDPVHAAQVVGDIKRDPVRELHVAGLPERPAGAHQLVHPRVRERALAGVLGAGGLGRIEPRGSCAWPAPRHLSPPGG